MEKKYLMKEPGNYDLFILVAQASKDGCLEKDYSVSSDFYNRFYGIEEKVSVEPIVEPVSEHIVVDLMYREKIVENLEYTKLRIKTITSSCKSIEERLAAQSELEVLKLHRESLEQLLFKKNFVNSRIKNNHIGGYAQVSA